MAMAIAIHNIPEVWVLAEPAFLKQSGGVLENLSMLQGVIVAAPVYAATGSRWKAMGTALASVRLERTCTNTQASEPVSRGCRQMLGYPCRGFLSQ